MWRRLLGPVCPPAAPVRLYTLVYHRSKSGPYKCASNTFRFPYCPPPPGFGLLAVHPLRRHLDLLFQYKLNGFA